MADDEFDIDIYGDSNVEQDAPAKDDEGDVKIEGIDGGAETNGIEAANHDEEADDDYVDIKVEGENSDSHEKGSDQQQQIKSTDESSHNALNIPKQAPQQQGVKRKEGSDDRAIDPGATTALLISELHWWNTDDDVRGWVNQAQVEDELLDITFSEHKVNGKSKGQAYVEFKSQQAATAAKHKIDAFGDGQQYAKKHTVTYSNPNNNPFRTLPKDAPARAGKDAAGPRSASGNFGGNFRGQGRTPGYNAGRGGMNGNMNQNNFNRNFSGPGMGNMGGFNGPMGGNFGGNMNGQFGGGFNRGGMMNGMRGGPGGMRGGRGGMNGMMGMPMGGMPMGGMPGMPMNMGQMGGMPGMVHPNLSQGSPSRGSSRILQNGKDHKSSTRQRNPSATATGSQSQAQSSPAVVVTPTYFPQQPSRYAQTPSHYIYSAPVQYAQQAKNYHNPTGGFQGNMQPHFNPAFFQQGQAAGGDWQNPHGAKRQRPE